MVWVTRANEEGPGPQVPRIVEGDWTVLPPLDDPVAQESQLPGREHAAIGAGHADFAAAADGTAWLANGDLHLEPERFAGLLRFDGERWSVVELPLELPGLQAGPLAVGPDGTLWLYAKVPQRRGPTDDFLLRHDGSGWSVFM